MSERWRARIAQLILLETVAGLPSDVIEDTQRLLVRLELNGSEPPDWMGCCDQEHDRILLEWHNWKQSGKAMTIDVLGNNQFERFYYDESGKPHIVVEGLEEVPV